MKKVFNKKMGLAIASGILAASVAMGGTFAWLNSGDGVNDGNFNAGQVTIVKEASLNKIYVEEIQGDQASLDAHSSLETSIKNAANDADKATAYSTWIKDQRSKASIVVKEVVDEGGTSTHKVTPGSFVGADYVFKNTSNVPIYIRIKPKAPQLQSNVGVSNFKYTSTNTELTKGKTDFYYLPVKIQPNQTLISFSYSTYLPGSANATFVPFGYGECVIEAIQATNNAAALNWSTDAGGNIFQ